MSHRRLRAFPSMQIAYGVLGLLALGYVGWRLWGQPGPNSSAIDGWSVDAFEVVASLLCLARARRRSQDRCIPLLFGAGLLAWAVGDTTLSIESLSGPVASPSLADIGWLLSYPLLYVALVRVVRDKVTRLIPAAWLDGAIAGLGAAALCATFLIGGIERSAGGRPLGVVVSLAYPIGDLLLLGLVVGCTAVQYGGRSRQWIVLAAAFLLIAVGDAFNVFPYSAGATGVGGFFDSVGWPIATLLISWSVWMRSQPPDPVASADTPGFLLPGAAAVAAFVILSTATLAGVGSVALGLATGTLAVAGLRLVLSARGLRTLTAERRLQAVTDELTGLGNRRQLFELLDVFFTRSGDPEQKAQRLAMLFVDLNHFKEINDSFGHAAGDQLLQQLGPRLRGSLRSGDLLVRLGGDELAVVLLDADAEDAARTAQRISSHLLAPFRLDAVEVTVSASIGIALSPDDATTALGLLRCADVAMYRAKQAGWTHAVYRPEFDSDGDRLRLVDDLRVAIEQGELVLHYQTQIEPRTREICGVEALLRWEHPRLGRLAPLDFLPLAEEAHLMRPLTAEVLDQALRQAAAWRCANPCLTMSVNVSTSNLLDDGFADLVEDLLRRYDLPGASLILEITETTIISDFERSRVVIDQLRGLGVGASIDDFGAGVTSLAYLGGLSVSELKLDRSFLVGVGARSTRGLALIGATIGMAHALGMRVVAEGVEDEEMFDTLARLDCDLMQGFHLGRPAPAEDLRFSQPRAPGMQTSQGADISASGNPLLGTVP